MNINELNAHIIEWAKERELDTRGTVEAQAIKTVEELSELIKAICKDKKEDIIDSIGDVYVTLVIGNMLDENYDLREIQEYIDVLFDDKAIKKCKNINKNYKLSKSAVFIQVILDYNYTYMTMQEIICLLTKIAYSYDLDFVECVESAYNTIKNRHGVMIDGVYVKDEDLASTAAQKATREFNNDNFKNFANCFTNDSH